MRMFQKRISSPQSRSFAVHMEAESSVGPGMVPSELLRWLDGTAAKNKLIILVMVSIIVQKICSDKTYPIIRER